MSRPENQRGGDAFDDFFGDPTPSGRMGPVPDEPAATPFAEEPTLDADLRRRTEEPTQAATPLPVIEPEPTPQGAVPDDWWDPEPVTVAAVPAAAAGTWQETGADEPETYPRRREQLTPVRATSPLALVALLVGGVLLGGLCVGGTVMALGGDDDQPVAQATVTTTSSPEATQPSSPSSTTQEPTSTEPTPTKTTTPSSTKTKAPKKTKTSKPTPTRPGTAPAGVKRCTGPSGGTSAGAGTTVTSCEFAAAVRDAYVAVDPANGATTLRVTSPVTNKRYTMTCSGQGVTRCTGGNDAVVVLF